MWPRESLPSTVNLFGGQSGRLKAFQAFQATIGFSVGRLYFGSWILKAPQAFHETIGFIVSRLLFWILDPRGLRIVNFCAIQIIRLDRLDVRHRTRSFSFG